MTVTRFCLNLMLSTILSAAHLQGKPSYRGFDNRSAFHDTKKTNAYYSQASNQTSDLKHEIENHEIEMRMFEERLNTLETIIDALRQQFLDANLANKELVKGNAVTLENKVSKIDSAVSGIIKDVHTLETHGNETGKLLTHYKKAISALEKRVEKMHSALESLLKALELEDAKFAQEYEVKSGDILEKIAKQHHTSVKKIKDLNGLRNEDRIYVGQKLKIP